MRLAPRAEKPAAPAGEAGLHLHAVLEQIPDAFLVTDTSLKILAANTAFLDLVRIATKEQATGQVLSRFLGRAGMSRNILVDNLRAHGSVRNFRTVLRNQFEDEETWRSPPSRCRARRAVLRLHHPRHRPPLHGARAHRPRPAPLGGEADRACGRVTLKELVRETTDLVERSDRGGAGADEEQPRLGGRGSGPEPTEPLSKLHRFDLGNLQGGDES